MSDNDNLTEIQETGTITRYKEHSIRSMTPHELDVAQKLSEKHPDELFVFSYDGTEPHAVLKAGEVLTFSQKPKPVTDEVADSIGRYFVDKAQTFEREGRMIKAHEWVDPGPGSETDDIAKAHRDRIRWDNINMPSVREVSEKLLDELEQYKRRGGKIK